MNNQLNQKIESLLRDYRTFSVEDHCWHLHTKGLYDIIKSYKRSEKIKFEFGQEARMEFLEQIKKIDELELDKVNKIEALKVKNADALAFKADLEANYQNYEAELLSYMKPGIKFYPHQISAAMFLKRVKSGLLSMEMGTGKSLASIAYVEMMGFKKVVVITPNSLKFNYYDEVQKFAKEGTKAHIINYKENIYSIKEAKYIIVNYDYFNPASSGKMDAKFNKLDLGFLECVVCDECFSYDTPIMTDVGELMIGDIVSYGLNVKIASYNVTSKLLEYKPIARYLSNGFKEIITVKLSNGKSIECTSDHKFYVDDRLVKAKNLKNGDKLRTLQTSFQKEESNTEVLFEKMLNNFNVKTFTRPSTKYDGKTWFDNKNRDTIMCNMLKDVSGEGMVNEEVLFDFMLGEMENDSAGNKNESLSYLSRKKDKRERKTFSFTKPVSCKKIVGENEIKQPHVQSRKCKKNDGQIERKNFFGKGRKWSINKTTGQVVRDYIGNDNTQHANGILNTCKESSERNECGSYKITTDSLQNGYWNTHFEIGNRSGWIISQEKKMDIFGQEKRGYIKDVWVESVEIHESTNRSEFKGSCAVVKKVFDLEVIDNHNYFANGVLVSNCHMLKNTDSNTYKNFKRIFKGVPCKVFLSGTPAPNKAKELYTVLNQISKLDFPTKKFFYETYCGMIQDKDVQGGWKYVEGLAKLEELFHKTAPYTYRKRKIDVLKDLPDKIYNRVLIEMTPEQQAIYDKIEEGVANEIFAESQMSAINMLTIMLRLRQYTSLLKVEPATELVERLLDEGEKAVVVDMFKPPLMKLQQRIGENVAVLHTGDQDVDERNRVKVDFQNPNGKSKVFLASIATTKYGLTLTAASKMFMLALPFSVGEYDQVADRLHRIGQKDTVFIYPLIVKGSIDEHVFRIIERKRVEINKVIDNEDYVSNVEESILSEILAILKKKYKK